MTNTQTPIVTYVRALRLFADPAVTLSDAVRANRAATDALIALGWHGYCDGVRCER